MREADLQKTFATQANEGGQVLGSYQDQFKVGRRSLLDVLDAQNTRFNAAVLVAASQYASLFADYQLLAANGDLLRALNVSPAAAGPGDCACTEWRADDGASRN